MRRIERITPTKALAPRSGRSSRSTLVITAWRRPILLHRLRHAQRLERVVVGGLARLDVAEAAAARAGVAEDHEGGGAALPALADVGAGGLLADRVEVLALDHPAQLAVARAARRRALEPGRLALAERAHLAHARARGRRRGSSASGCSRGHRLALDAAGRGDTSRCRSPNASAKRHAIRLRKQGRRAAARRSRATPRSSARGRCRTARSTRTAGGRCRRSRPARAWSRRRDTCTPIEAILRVAGPDAGEGRRRAPRRRCPRRRSAATIARSIVCTKSATPLHRHDRVGHELARAVVGHAAAAVGVARRSMPCARGTSPRPWAGRRARCACPSCTRAGARARAAGPGARPPGAASRSVSCSSTPSAIGDRAELRDPELGHVPKATLRRGGSETSASGPPASAGGCAAPGCGPRSSPSRCSTA